MLGTRLWFPPGPCKRRSWNLPCFPSDPLSHTLLTQLRGASPSESLTFFLSPQDFCLPHSLSPRLPTPCPAPMLPLHVHRARGTAVGPSSPSPCLTVTSLPRDLLQTCLRSPRPLPPSWTSCVLLPAHIHTTQPPSFITPVPPSSRVKQTLLQDRRVGAPPSLPLTVSPRSPPGAFSATSICSLAAWSRLLPPPCLTVMTLMPPPTPTQAPQLSLHLPAQLRPLPLPPSDSHPRVHDPQGGLSASSVGCVFGFCC